jgi:hypothetical protein
MKRLIPAIVFLLVAGAVGTWLTVSVRARSKYDQMTKELSVVSYTVKPFDVQFSGFLADVERNWIVRTNTVGGPHSEGLKLAGMPPSPDNLTHLLTCPMPAWSWVSTQRNRQSVILGMVKGQLLMTTVDGAIHVTPDKSTTAIWCHTNMLYVFRNDTGGMREILYIRKKTSNQASEATSEPAPSAVSSSPQG